MRRKPRNAALLLITLLALLLAARMGLPEVARQMVNNRLAQLEDYQGYIKDIDIALWRGAYTIEGLSIDKRRHPGALCAGRHHRPVDQLACATKAWWPISTSIEVNFVDEQGDAANEC